MPEVDNSHEPERPDDHDRWLAMQSAYAEYRRASEELECTRQSADDTNERLKLPVLEGQQWLAFERYLESRMEFLEARFDESTRPGSVPVVPRASDMEDSGSVSWLAFANWKPILPFVAVLLLCTMAFALVREQKHVRDLEASRDELQATLDQTRESLRLLGQKLDAWGPPLQHSAVQQVEHTPRPPVRRAPAAATRAPHRAMKEPVKRKGFRPRLTGSLSATSSRFESE
jgi:hypothetical protein